jgi:uncharacterized membrane protein YdbT with pleckstrin-like domain
MLRARLYRQLARIGPDAWQNRVAMRRERIHSVDFTQPVSLDILGLVVVRAVIATSTLRSTDKRATLPSSITGNEDLPSAPMKLIQAVEE